MKKIVVLVVVIVGAWFAWKHFGKSGLVGKEIPESERVTFITARDKVSVADNLDAGIWTLVLFTEPGSAESKALETKLEVAVRQKVSTVRMMVIDVGGLGTPAAMDLGLTKLPTAWLFDGVAKKQDEIPKILTLLGA